MANSTNQTGAGISERASLVPLLLLNALACMAAVIAVLDFRAYSKLREVRSHRTEIPRSGSLRGQEAFANSEWPGERYDYSRYVVLFLLSPDAPPLAYWREVAIRSLSRANNVEFVAVCTARNACGDGPPVDNVLTILSSMDPFQMRVLSVAAGQGRALLYRGPMLQEAPLIGNSAELLAGVISQRINRQDEKERVINIKNH